MDAPPAQPYRFDVALAGADVSAASLFNLLSGLQRRCQSVAAVIIVKLVARKFQNL